MKFLRRSFTVIFVAVAALFPMRQALAIQCLEDQDCWNQLQEGLTREMRSAVAARDIFASCGDVDSSTDGDVLSKLKECLKRSYAGYDAELRPTGFVLIVFGSTEAAGAVQAWKDLSDSIARHSWRLFGRPVNALEDRRRRPHER